MREIRTFEFDQPDQTTRIFIDRPHTLRVCRGMLWITIAGEAADLWLRAGESIEVQAGATIWVSAEQGGGRFDLAFESALPSLRGIFERVVASLIRRPNALYL